MKFTPQLVSLMYTGISKYEECLLAKGFGHLATVRGLITYKISPFEQRAFAGVLTKGVPNTFRRIRESFWRVTPPFIISYIVYHEVEKEHARLLRKNPADYECEDED